MFTGLDVTLSVVVSSAIAILIGLAIGVCGTYLLVRKKMVSPDNKEVPVTPVTLVTIESPSHETPPTLPPPRQGSPLYEEVYTETEMEVNYAYMRASEFQ